MLSLGAMSGYDIRRVVAESIGYFWSESYGQIYPALKRLENAGLAARKTERQSGRPDRQVYSTTRKGQAALEAWLERPARMQPARNELLLKLFFGMHVPPTAAIRELEQLREADSARLRTFAMIRQRITREQKRHPGLPYWLITLDSGLRFTRARLAWAEKSLATLRRLEKIKRNGK
jgi:DNA-binding PadR family transcriptional regulator